MIQIDKYDLFFSIWAGCAFGFATFMTLLGFFGKYIGTIFGIISGFVFLFFMINALKDEDVCKVRATFPGGNK